MYYHHELGSGAFERSKRVLLLIKAGEIAYGGNRKLKIYGRLTCSSGKRMQAKHRLFFKNEQEAMAMGYRPCGHCMREEYGRWKGGE
jgi:methylphosphotriester-DNA--protein-cysteine methyltransferase